MRTEQEIYKEVYDKAVAFVNKQIRHTVWRQLDGSSKVADIPTNDIATKLIQSAGRYCKTNASDFLLLWSEVLLELDNKQENDKIFVFAIREGGVDGNKLFNLRIHCKSDSYYRDVYFLRVLKKVDNKVFKIHLNLIDVNNMLTNQEKEDLFNTLDLKSKNKYEREINLVSPNALPS